ncbi:nitroreductase family protein [Paenibacillus sp. y28]|uniref:nitroreductase family protein n=1 Tax=Paenibacillus sp. y28 TaxID=3129110 RepID=UPI003018138F
MTVSTSNKPAAILNMEARHSVKQYQPGVAIPEQELEQLLQAAQTAPSSWNLQQWKLLVIDDQAQKEKLLPIAYNQKQIVESSVVIAILGDLEGNLNAEPVFGPLAEKGQITQEIKESLIGQINGAYKSPQVARDEAVLNSSLLSMQLMLAAKALGYDTCPMGGFNKAQFAEAFHVPARYIPVMLITVGKAAKEAYASSRLPLDEVVVRNSF